MAPVRPRRRAPRFTALFALLFAFCGLTEDVALCEEAAAHLTECCPGVIPARVRCEEPVPLLSCETSDIEAELGRSIVGRSCDELHSDGTCAYWVERTNPPPPPASLPPLPSTPWPGS